MPPLNKALRIGLPAATATTATILTACLICLKNDDLDKEKELQDLELKDFVDSVQDFKEEEVLDPKEEIKDPSESKENDADKVLIGDSEEEISEEDIPKDSGLSIKDVMQKIKDFPKEFLNTLKQKAKDVKEKVAQLIGKGETGTTSQFKDQSLSNPSSGDSLQDQPQGGSISNVEQSGNPSDFAQQETNSISAKGTESTLQKNEEGGNQEETQRSESSENPNGERGQVQSRDAEEPLADPSSAGSQSTLSEGEIQAEETSAGSPEKGGKPQQEGLDSSPANMLDSAQSDNLSEVVGSSMQPSGEEPRPAQENELTSDRGSSKSDLSQADGDSHENSVGELGTQKGVDGGNSQKYSEEGIRELEAMQGELLGVESELNDLFKH